MRTLFDLAMSTALTLTLTQAGAAERAPAGTTVTLVTGDVVTLSAAGASVDPAPAASVSRPPRRGQLGLAAGERGGPRHDRRADDYPRILVAVERPDDHRAGRRGRDRSAAVAHPPGWRGRARRRRGDRGTRSP
jgi:hypothetical protein